jgi:hypothetical protein
LSTLLASEWIGKRHGLNAGDGGIPDDLPQLIGVLFDDLQGFL